MPEKKPVRLSRKPKNATIIRHETTKAAWWYENAKSVDVFLEPMNGPIVSCRIYWRDLVKAWERAGAPR